MIEVASMGGSDSHSGMRRVLVGDLVADRHLPSGLTVDAVNERVYWCDVKASSLESVSFDGKERRQVSKKKVKNRRKKKQSKTEFKKKKEKKP